VLRREAAWLAGSLLLHAALIVAVLLWLERRPPVPADLPAPSFEVVYEGGQPERPEAEAPEGIEVPPAPPAAAPPPTVGEVAPPPAVEPVPAPPAPEAPPPPTPTLVPPEPAAVPPPPEPPPRLAEPPPVPPLPGLAEILPPPRELRLPERYEPPPAPASPPPPQAAPPSRQAAPVLPPGTVWMPEGLQLGRPAQPSPPAGRPQGRGLDLRVDPRIAEGRTSPDPTVRVTGAQVGADWRAAFRRWLDQHIHYPRRAIELAESGAVRVRITAAPDGQVQRVQLVGPSGSPSLNLATTFPFNGARLPAFPPPANPDGVTIDLTVNYILIRR
jgi:TonB family protein